MHNRDKSNKAAAKVRLKKKKVTKEGVWLGLSYSSNPRLQNDV